MNNGAIKRNQKSVVEVPLGPVMLDIAGTELSAEDRRTLLYKQVGGIIFFSRNFQSYAQIKSLVTDIREIRPDLLLAVDQEGGSVQRFHNGFTRIPPMQCFNQLYNEDSDRALVLARDTGWLMAAEILSCNIDFSFAPVLDVDEKYCSAIADRAFSSDPDKVTVLAGAFIEGMHEAGMAATGKHFPGHGKVSSDSHLKLPVDSRVWDDIANSDLKPFTALAPVVDALMPAHILFLAVDSQPVGFSSIWLQQKLRQQMQFKGVIFSDDLSMAAASGAGNYGDRAEAALRAGCDMILVCNNRPGALAALTRVEDLNWEVSRRLCTMRRRRVWQKEQLRNNKRWQRTVASLETIGRG